ncbi:hypothetical protein PC128_g14702 [Phytophthora cactorum]|nr:hypothetical protein PC128_g14702 [Phytophthora cactorum]
MTLTLVLAKHLASVGTAEKRRESFGKWGMELSLGGACGYPPSTLCVKLAWCATIALVVNSKGWTRARLTLH